MAEQCLVEAQNQLPSQGLAYGLSTACLRRPGRDLVSFTRDRCDLAV